MTKKPHPLLLLLLPSLILLAACDGDGGTARPPDTTDSAADVSASDTVDAAASDTVVPADTAADSADAPDAASDVDDATDTDPDVDGAADTDPAPDVDDAADTGPADTSPPGEAITAPATTWTWVDFPDALCDDGSSTGLGVNLNPASDDLLVFMQGGGACWDYGTCLVLNTAVHGPFKAANFESAKGGFPSAFDRDDVSNPFRDWSYVFVPYCTGDLHAGNQVKVYLDLFNQPHDYHHVGHQNVLAYLARLRATFPAIDRLMLSGASAGGYGVLFNYDAFRTQLAPAESAFIDDSGPPLIGNGIQYPIRDAWWAAWDPTATFAPYCDADCLGDVSLVLKHLAARYPDDRMSLLSSLRDITIRTYLGLAPEAFEADLRALVATRIDPEDNVRAFIIPGESHTMLGAVASFPGLAAFIDAQLTGAGWTSVVPP